jgi:hypothetical protein
MMRCRLATSDIIAKVWRILDYEVQMFLGIDYVRSHLQVEGDAQLITNALVESSLLHIRILADIFLSRGKRADDIDFAQLGFNTDSIEPALAEKVNTLAVAYGEANDPTSNCWILNKMLAHPTKHRTEGYDYSDLFATLDKPLRAIIEYIYDYAKRPLPFRLTS